MLLHFAHKEFEQLLPTLLDLWPEEGHKWKRKNVAKLKKLREESSKIKLAASDGVTLSTSISREQLLEYGRKVVRGVSYSTPFNFQRMNAPAKTLNSKAIKVRPGSDLNIAIEGNPTTARIETIRRIKFRGKWNCVKASLIINTENIPFYLDRESKCDCRYCGSRVIGDEVSCRNCGAELPAC